MFYQWPTTYLEPPTIKSQILDLEVLVLSGLRLYEAELTLLTEEEEKKKSRGKFKSLLVSPSPGRDAKGAENAPESRWRTSEPGGSDERNQPVGRWKEKNFNSDTTLRLLQDDEQRFGPRFVAPLRRSVSAAGGRQ